MKKVVARRPGWRFFHVGTGHGGLELAAAIHPDLIFLDLHLPDTEGIDVLATLRKDPGTTSTPVVVVSADAYESQFGKLRAAGADAYLTKPLVVQEIYRTLDQYDRDPTSARSYE